MLNLGIVRPGQTIYIPFQTFDSNDPSASVTITGLATTDIEVYKDGGTTQRASDAGFALLDTDGIDFDGTTGIHGISIDLADNTTAGFYAAGSQYWVVIASITVDAATVNLVAARFTIGYPDALINTTIATLASQTSFTLTDGPAEDDALNGCIVWLHDVASKVQCGSAVIQDYTGSTKTVTLAAGTTFTAAATDNIAIFPPALVPATLGRTLAVDANGRGDISLIEGTDATDQINAACDASIETYHLDHLLAADYDPASKPGTATALLNELVENDGGVSRFTTNALEQAPSGGGGGGLTALASGTAQGGTSTTIQLASAETFSDDILNGCAVNITGGTGAGQSRVITDYTGATDTATVTPAWTTNPSSDSTYEVVQGSSNLAAVGNTAQTAGDIMGTLGAAGAGLTAIPWNSAWDAEVQSEVDDALVAQKLDHVANVAISAWSDVTANSILDFLADDGTSTFDRSTHSLQAFLDAVEAGVTLVDGPHGGSSAVLTLDHVVISSSTHDAIELVTTAAGMHGFNIHADNSTGIGMKVYGEQSGMNISNTAASTLGGLVVSANGSGAGLDVFSNSGDAFQLSSTSGELIEGSSLGPSVTTEHAFGAAVLNAGTVNHTVAGSFGKILGDNVDAPISTVDTVVDAIKVVTDALTAAAAAKLAKSAAGIIDGTAQTGTLSTTQATTDLSGYADDELIGGVIIFTGGTAAGQRSDITDYASASGLVTFTAITTAPANGDSFVIV